MLNIDQIKDHARKWRGFIIDAIYPVECLSCGAEGSWLCPVCASRLTYKNDQYCLECKRINNDGGFCSDCRSKYFLDGVIIAGDYDDKLLANLIKFFKYHFIQDLAQNLGNYLFDFISQSEEIKNAIQDCLVIPVPLHKKRILWRGFNQTELIATRLAKRLDLPTECTNLVRIKNTKPQAKFKEAQRKNNIKECFAWRGQDLQGRNIILIDDIVTTGATLNECAKVLKASGAGQVIALVVAKG